MRITSIIAVALLASACTTTPVAPTPVPAAAVERSPAQITVRVLGPSGWYPDRIYIDATVWDQRGAVLPAVVSCDVSAGHLEPRQWDTAHRAGVLWIGASPGARFGCRVSARPEITADYVTTEADYRMPAGCCGTPPPPPPPPPPPGGTS